MPSARERRAPLASLRIKALPCASHPPKIKGEGELTSDTDLSLSLSARASVYNARNVRLMALSSGRKAARRRTSAWKVVRELESLEGGGVGGG